MENQFLNSDNYIYFRRTNNPIKGIWHFYKNDYSIAPIFKNRPQLSLFFIIVILSLILIFVIAGGWYGLPVLLLLMLIFFLLELTLYVLATKFFKIYRTNEIALSDNDIVFWREKSEYKEKILYQNIERISYSSFIIKIIIISNFSKLLSHIIFYMRHFIIEYKNSVGEKNKLFIPLDLVGLPDFLHTVIKKSALQKVQPTKFNLFFEWQKPPLLGKIEMTQDQELHVNVIENRTKDIDLIRLVLITLIIIASVIVISYFGNFL